MKKLLILILILLTIITIFTGYFLYNNQIEEKTNTLDSATKITFNPPKHEIYKHIEGSIEPEIIFNDKGIIITAKGFDFSDIEPKFIFEIKNNSKYKFEFNSEDVTVNDFFTYTEIEEELLSGENKEIVMTFLDAKLFTKRISTIDDISFTINMTRYDKKPPYKEYSTGLISLSTKLKANELPEIKNKKNLIKNEDIEVIYLDMEQTIEETILYFYLKNNTSQTIIISTPKRKAKISDKTVEISFSYDVLPYKKTIGKLIIKNEELKDIDKTKVNSLTTEFMVFDKKTHATILKTEEILIPDLQQTIKK